MDDFPFREVEVEGRSDSSTSGSESEMIMGSSDSDLIRCFGLFGAGNTVSPTTTVSESDSVLNLFCGIAGGRTACSSLMSEALSSSPKNSGVIRRRDGADWDILVRFMLSFKASYDGDLDCHSPAFPEVRHRTDTLVPPYHPQSPHPAPQPLPSPSTLHLVFAAHIRDPLAVQ